MKLVLTLKENSDREPLSCLLCGYPKFNFNNLEGHFGYPCEYTVTYRTDGKTVMTGAHKVCVERNHPISAPVVDVGVNASIRRAGYEAALERAMHLLAVQQRKMQLEMQSQETRRAKVTDYGRGVLQEAEIMIQGLLLEKESE